MADNPDNPFSTNSAPPGTIGLLHPGTIDPFAPRPIVHNIGDQNGPSISTTLSMSTEDPGVGEVLFPRVVGGKVLSEKEAFDHYKKTGEHFGIFNTSGNAELYANWMHNEQVKRGAPSPPPSKRLFQHETSEKKPEDMFDPQRMEKTILRLQSEDRLPGEQEFIRQIGKVRTKYRPQILEERNPSPEK